MRRKKQQPYQTRKAMNKASSEAIETGSRQFPPSSI